MKFMSARTGISIPEWWRKSFEDMDLSRGMDHAFFSVVKPPSSTDLTGIADNQGGPNNGGRFDKSIISVLGRTYKLPPFANEFWSNSPVMNYYFGAADTFLAPETGAGFPYNLYCFDKERNLRWRAQVWSAGRTILQGRAWHSCSFVLTADVIAVYGIECGGAYAEAFRLTDGKPVFRFCSCYWFNWSEAWKLPWAEGG